MGKENYGLSRIPMYIEKSYSQYLSFKMTEPKFSTNNSLNSINVLTSINYNIDPTKQIINYMTYQSFNNPNITNQAESKQVEKKVQFKMEEKKEQESKSDEKTKDGSNNDSKESAKDKKLFSA